MAERWLRVDAFVSKIESELRKPVYEQNQLLLAFWNSQLASSREMELAELKSLFENALKTMTALVAMQSDSVLLDSLSQDSDRERQREQFETNVAVGYGCINQSTHPDMLRCVVTNQFHPQDLVCKGAHLLAVSEKRALPLVGLSKSDLWDPRNGLCVLRTIHKRFEDKELVYMPVSGSPDEYRLEVLYDDLLLEELGITVGELSGTIDVTPATFADINGRPLTFTTPVRPFRRVLLFVAFSAFTRALENTRRSHALATAATPGDTAAWRVLFDAATGAGSPSLLLDGFVMQRFLAA